MDNEPEQQGKIRNPDGTFPKGVSGNPAGRPKEQTLKDFAREWFRNLTPEEKLAYMNKVESKRPGFAWPMAEGNPHQTSEMAVNAALTITFDNTFKDAPDSSPKAEGDSTE